MTPLERAHFVRERMPGTGLFAEKTWRVAPRAFALSPTHVTLLEKLGLVLHRFNTACNLLYRQSAAGKAHPWVAPLLDADQRRLVDNMEGLSVRRDQKGDVWVYVISDDNFSPLQHTYLMMFHLKPEPDVTPPHILKQGE